MAEPKTKETDADVDAFIQTVADERKRKDCEVLVELMQQATNAPPKMWGSSIVGFGTYSQTYSTGKKMDWPPIAFSPRKNTLTLYGLLDSAEHTELLAQLGKHKTGKGCLYIKKLTDIDQQVLQKLITIALAHKAKNAA